MRKFMVFFIAVLLLSMTVAAKPSQDDLVIRSVMVGDYGFVDSDEMFVRVSLKSFDNLKDLTVKVYLDGDLVDVSHEFDLVRSNNRRTTKLLYTVLPGDVEQGLHWVKIVVSNDYVSKVRYRHVLVV